jgi:energy-converting hydrogenase Eha subunit G
MRMDKWFPRWVLLVWPENSQQGIHDVRWVVWTTGFHGFWRMSTTWNPTGFHTTFGINFGDAVIPRSLFVAF